MIWIRWLRECLQSGFDDTMKWYNLLGVVIFCVSVFDWLSLVAFGWKLTPLPYWVDVVFMIAGIGIAFHKPEERKEQIHNRSKLL